MDDLLRGSEMTKYCPFKAGVPYLCDGELCQLWDKGIYDVYEPGCGLVPRGNRRV